MVVTRDAARRRAIGQILLLSAGFLVLVAISASSVILVNSAREANGSVVHTVEVESQINELLLDIRRAESAARGYLLTSGPDFLSDHNTAVAAVLPDLDTLSQLTADNPVQVENIKR
jgi:CHASE3 domain sensor protein